MNDQDSTPAAGIVEARCFKCNEKKPMSNPVVYTMKNGKPAARGVCAVCGTKMHRIGRIN